MKALVTGATGFVGSSLVRRLQKAGWELNLLVRPEGDLSNIESLKKAISGVDVVFHLAAALPHHHLEAREYWDTNVVGTRNLLEVCRGKRIKRFVHVSTVGIYDKPSSIYSRSKKRGEGLVMKYYRKYKMPVVIIRPTIAYGPGDMRPGFLNLFKLIKRGVFVPVGKCDNFFHTIYIDNLVDALVISATSKKAVGEDFIIGDDPIATMKQILAEMFELNKRIYPIFYIPVFLARIMGIFFDFVQEFGLPAFLPTQRVKFMTENRKYDVTKAEEILNWRPRIDIWRGLSLTYLWYRKEGLL